MSMPVTCGFASGSPSDSQPPSPRSISPSRRRWRPTRGSRTRFLNVWAALSTPLFILAVVGVFVVPHEPVTILLAGVVFLFLTMESWARRRMLALATGLLMLGLGKTGWVRRAMRVVPMPIVMGMVAAVFLQFG